MDYALHVLWLKLFMVDLSSPLWFHTSLLNCKEKKLYYSLAGEKSCFEAVLHYYKLSHYKLVKLPSDGGLFRCILCSFQVFPVGV